MAALLAEMADVEAGLGRERQGPRGVLRVNASVPLGMNCLIPILPRFNERYPEVIIGPYAFRRDHRSGGAGVPMSPCASEPLRDTRLMARKLGRSPLVLVASPDYLAAHGTPANPAALEGHRCLQFSFPPARSMAGRSGSGGGSCNGR